MLPFVFTTALALCFRGTSAVPQTLSPNSTTAYSLGPQITKAPTGNCSNDCVYNDSEVYNIRWSQKSITATYIAETVVFVVNKNNNSTRTTTISNTEINFGDIATPTNLNSDGTVTASVVGNDGSTRIVAYPTTVYGGHAEVVSWTGTLSSTVIGIPTCLIAPTGTVAVYPSHALLPEAVQTDGVDVTEDPRGWTFIAKWESNSDTSLVKNFFPGFGVWNCSVVAPLDVTLLYAALQTALYLTKTSTSTEPDDGPTSTEATALSTHSSVAHAERPASADTPISSNHPAEISPSIEKTSSEILPAQAPSGLGGSEVISSVHGLVPSITSAQVDPVPIFLEPASELLPSKSIVITPLPASATALPTTPVAVLVPVTSTDSKGGITISTSTAVVHPVIASSTNAQGSTVLSTSLSTLSISASLPYIITSTIAQGTIVSYTAHLPAIILITTNAATSVLTPVLLPTTPPAITIGSDTITANSETQYVIGSQKLTAGGVVTISGTRVSLAAGESDVVLGSSTEALAPYITAGFGTGSNGTGVQIFTGDAKKRLGSSWGRRELWMVGLGAVVVVWLKSSLSG